MAGGRGLLMLLGPASMAALSFAAKGGKQERGHDRVLSKRSHALLRLHRTRPWKERKDGAPSAETT